MTVAYFVYASYADKKTLFSFLFEVQVSISQSINLKSEITKSIFNNFFNFIFKQVTKSQWLWTYLLYPSGPNNNVGIPPGDSRGTGFELTKYQKFASTI